MNSYTVNINTETIFHLYQKRLPLAAALALALLAPSCRAEEAKRIEDNSFLLEEAYNQEAGVVQHIQTWQYLRDSRSWGYSFTQEWPVPGQKHQFSYTVPVLRLDPGMSAHVGDIALNYRYQLLLEQPVAVSPRLSLLLPTGSHKDGSGAGAAGAQANLPLSVRLGERWVTHWNSGLTFVPASREPGGDRADTLAFNLGTSAILALSSRFNLLCEAIWTSFETVQPGGGTVRQETAFISPGARLAIDFKSGLQVVPGIAFPVGVGSSKGENGVFLYLSFEHALF